jgi:hypothetical protein
MRTTLKKIKNGPLAQIKFWKYHNPNNKDNKEISYFKVPDDLEGNFLDIVIERACMQYLQPLDSSAPRQRTVGNGTVKGDYFYKTYFQEHQVFNTMIPCTEEEYKKAVEEINKRR